jgi:hypothetical protein
MAHAITTGSSRLTGHIPFGPLSHPVAAAVPSRLKLTLPPVGAEALLYNSDIDVDLNFTRSDSLAEISLTPSDPRSPPDRLAVSRRGGHADEISQVRAVGGRRSIRGLGLQLTEPGQSSRRGPMEAPDVVLPRDHASVDRRLRPRGRWRRTALVTDLGSESAGFVDGNACVARTDPRQPWRPNWRSVSNPASSAASSASWSTAGVRCQPAVRP